MSPVAVLCAADRSVYKTLPGTVVYDRLRDARTFGGGMSVIAHPPCAQWSRLRAFAREDAEEKALAWFCWLQVKREGGVLEHPYPSLFFREAGIEPFVVDQSWWGFPTRKRTGLAIVGRRIPAMPFHLGNRFTDMKRWPQVRRSETTLAFAQWLLDLARSV